MSTKIALILAVGLFASGRAAADASEPTLNQIQDAFKAESRCELADPAGLLAELPLAYLADIQRKALHSDALELTKLSASGDVGLSDYLNARRLRVHGKFDLPDVFAIDCNLRTNKVQLRALSQLRPSDAIVMADFAWIPLVTSGQEYLGSGLVFVQENGKWRYLEIELLTLGNTADSKALRQDLSSYLKNGEVDPAVFVASCPMPKAPQPQLNFDLLKEYERDINIEVNGDAEFDAKNALGALQRAAVRRHAEGKQVAPSAVAQLLFAEVLIRSLEFDSAPKLDSPQWLSRVTRAEQFFDQAQARGADLTRFLPLIPWLAEVNLKGSGTHPIDIAKAKQLYKLAAEAGNSEAATLFAQFKTTGFAATPVDCAGALELLKLHAEDYSDNDFALNSALVISQCADTTFREKNMVQLPDLLKKVNPKYLDGWQKTEFLELQAFVNCKASSNLSHCVAPQPQLQPGVTEAMLAKTKLDGQNDMPSMASPGRFRDAPKVELISCD